MVSELIVLAHREGAASVYDTKRPTERDLPKAEVQKQREVVTNLQITLDPVILEPKVERPNMEDNEGDKRSKEEKFAQHLLKVV